jgi:hypothetical protein
VKIKTPPHRTARLVLLDGRVKMASRWAITPCLCEWCEDEIRTGGEYLTPVIPEVVIREKTKMYPGQRIVRRFHPFCWERAQATLGEKGP